MASSINADNGVSSGSAGLKSSADSSGVLQLQTNGTTAVTVDTSQNVGVGVVPSTWSAGLSAIQLNTSGSISSGLSGNSTYLAQNWYYNSASKYIGNGYGLLYEQNKVSGLHVWYNSANNSSGAGASLTLTQAMTLDASGRLGVGASSLSAKLTVIGGNSNTIIADNDGSQYTQLLLQRNSTANTGGDLLIDGTNATMSLRMLAVGALRFCTSTSVGDGTERARITSAGDLLVGGTTARTRLTLQAGEANAPTLGTASGGAFFGNSNVTYGTMFGTSGAGYGWIQQQRVDGSATAYDLLLQPSGGNLLVRTTSQLSPGGVVGVTSLLNPADDGAWALALQNNATTATKGRGLGIRFATDYNNTSNEVIYFAGNATARFIVYSNGNVQNTNNSYGSISDIKLKENITDATPKLAQLNQVRVVNYNLIGETQKQIGVVAQELEQIFPGMVEETPDRDAEGNDTGTTTKSVKYSVFVPMLIKALQEQQALITQLQADVAALKGASA